MCFIYFIVQFYSFAKSMTFPLVYHQPIMRNALQDQWSKSVTNLVYYSFFITWTQHAKFCSQLPCHDLKVHSKGSNFANTDLYCYILKKKKRNILPTTEVQKKDADVYLL